MSRHVVTLPMTSLILGALLAFYSAPALAATVLINDGQSSVVTTGGGSQNDLTRYVVRDLGCGVPDPFGQPCLSAGTPTHVEIGEVTDGLVSELLVLDSSSVIVDGLDLRDVLGRSLGSIGASGSSHVDLRSGFFSDLSLAGDATGIVSGTFDTTWRGGGQIILSENSSAFIAAEFNGLSLRDNARASLSGLSTGVRLAGKSYLDVVDASIGFGGIAATGGEIAFRSGFNADLYLIDTAMRVYGGTPSGPRMEIGGSSHLTLNGGSFRIDGVPVNFGEVSADSGLLEVTYPDGQSYSTTFYRGPASTLTLVPEPNSALLVGLGLVVLASSRPRAWVAVGEPQASLMLPTGVGVLAMLSMLKGGA